MKKNDYLEELKEMAGEFDDEPKSNGADSEEMRRQRKSLNH